MTTVVLNLTHSLLARNHIILNNEHDEHNIVVMDRKSMYSLKTKSLCCITLLYPVLLLFILYATYEIAEVEKHEENKF
jgi:hypothetical protein